MEHVPFKTPLEILRSETSSYQSKARQAFAGRGADAYDVINNPPGLNILLEYEIALADFKKRGGHISFGQFIYHSELARVMNDKYMPVARRLDAAHGTNVHQMNAIVGMEQVWHHSIHMLSGEHNYEVDPNLAQMLKNTALRGVRADDMRLPFRSICVMVPEHIVDLHLLSHRGEGWRARCFCIVEDQPDPLVKIDQATVMRGDHVVNVATDLRYDENFEGRVWRVLCFSGRPGESQVDERIQQLHIPLPNGATADEILARIPTQIEGWRDLFKWVMNVVMYATWPDADAEHVMANEDARRLWGRILRAPKGKKRDALRERFKAMNPMHRIHLGRRTPKWEADPGKQAAGSPLMVRTLVQGHWQRYHVGPRGQDAVKWSFRQPFWRGPEGAPVSTPTRVLK